jgi:hypothetical protein
MTSVVAVIIHGDGDDVRIKMRVGARRDKGQFDVGCAIVEEIKGWR